jgi:hypothetical protein
MSILRVNTIYPQSGTNISIPAGYTLSLGGTVINASTMMPTPVGQSGKFLVSDGSSSTWQSVGPRSMQVFTSSSTWNRPAGITRILVRLTGAGGGGSGHGEGGGAGGYAEKVIDVTGISSVAITVGTGGGGSYYSGAAGGGGTTSFGAYLSATGGNGANSNQQHCGGLPGLGSGGDINIYGFSATSGGANTSTINIPGFKVTSGTQTIKGLSADQLLTVAKTIDKTIDPNFVATVSGSGGAAAGTNKLELIIKEYFLAAWGNGIEPYNAYRRTGYPSNFQPTLEHSYANDELRSAKTYDYASPLDLKEHPSPQ